MTIRTDVHEVEGEDTGKKLVTEEELTIFNLHLEKRQNQLLEKRLYDTEIKYLDAVIDGHKLQAENQQLQIENIKLRKLKLGRDITDKEASYKPRFKEYQEFVETLRTKYDIQDEKWGIHPESREIKEGG